MQESAGELLGVAAWISGLKGWTPGMRQRSGWKYVLSREAPRFRDALLDLDNGAR